MINNFILLLDVLSHLYEFKVASSETVHKAGTRYPQRSCNCSGSKLQTGVLTFVWLFGHVQHTLANEFSILPTDMEKTLRYLLPQQHWSLACRKSSTEHASLLILKYRQDGSWKAQRMVTPVL
jgi:hypothetical protein